VKKAEPLCKNCEVTETVLVWRERPVVWEVETKNEVTEELGDDANAG